MAANAPRSYRYTDILALYEDRERNALLPDRDERCLQSSSTDSRSVYDEATDTYLYWDANSGDGYCYHGAFTDENGVNYIALDVKGAGFLSGLWFGTLNEGEADLIIDGVRFDNGGRRAKDLFEARGKFEGLDGLIYNTPGPAWVFDLPISFSKSCRIVLREGWGLYYHIDFVLFPEGTQVEPFPSEFSPEQRKAVETLNAHFLNQDNYVLPMPASEPERLRAGEIRTVFETSGSGALSSVHLLIPGFSDMTPSERERLSLGLTISMYWDGSDQPAVWAPVGGFFGSPLGDPLDSFALTLTEDGHFLSRFLMPYADGARIELHNETEAVIDFLFAVETASLSRPIGDYGRFHAKWSRNMHPVLRPDRFPDHTWLRTSGRGRYLGVSFHAYEREDFGWWGEGDEKIFVDGEKYPSWFGTGSEDYFGFCWGKPIMFQRPYHAQIRQDGGFYGAGHKVDLRLHHVDSIPFQNEIEVTIEKYLEESKVSYDTVCFWYLSPAGLDDYPVVPFRERIAYWSEYVYRPVERIELRHKSVTLAENEECRIVWNVLPVDHSDSRELVWTSSDPETVSVDSRGQILALKPGKARLIASIGRVKSSCLVTVTPKQDPPPANPGDLDYVKAHTVGLYTFEDPSSPGRDFSGSGNDLTFYTRIDGAYTVCPEACRIVPAMKGKKALYFDGVTFLTRDQGVGSAFDSLHTFTVSYRSHMPAYGADGTREMKRNYKTILDKGGFTSRTGWVMCSENDTLVAANEFMSIWDRKAEFHLNIVNAPHFIALCWTQITFTVNADTGRVAVFHNRDLVKEMTVADLHPENPDHPFTLGGAIVPAGNGWEILNNSGFVGELTDVRILDVALEDGQIAALQ